jgi:ABC-type multidrug transport system ATPase subunit/pSer/pThr/pTyr-binding forkhead associated (FHA) protein
VAGWPERASARARRDEDVDVIPGFGKQNLTVGSLPTCDVVLSGAGVLPEHARIIHLGGGKLVFVCGAGPAHANGRSLHPGEQAPFDLRTQFTVGTAQVPVPLHHPAITLALMATGMLVAPPGQIILGRDPSRSSIVIQHPSVSSQHATVAVDRMVVIDHNSTSGTYVGTTRIPAGTPVPIDPNLILAFGPVPVQVQLLQRLAQAPRPALGSSAIVMSPAPAPVQPAPALAPQAPSLLSPTAPQPGVPPAPLPGAGLGTQSVGGAVAAAAAAMAEVAGPQKAGAPGKKNKTVLGQLDFTQAAQQVKTIGRTPDNDIVISHPQVSSRHAFLHRIQGQIFVEDRGSANGTFVRGARVAPGQRVPVQSGEKIYIGPMPLQIEQSASGAAEIIQEEYAADRWAGRPLYEIEAWSLHLEVPDRDNPAEMKILLDNVSFKALPGDMIALMGPSGAGKTTLLLALNGYLPPTNGIVRINGEDLYNIYDNLRGSIGYVPQDDLVHAELTVFEAVKYSAKFRLPPDYSEDEIDARVEQTIKDLGLEGVKNLQIGRPEKKVLSGGQRKRVNIALELVTDPVILFLDEPTSGLAADDTTALITLLSDLTKQTGKTIIMTIHQPAKDEFEKFTHCLVMGYGGVPMFFGPTRDCYRFFGTWKERQRQPNDIDNPRDMFEMIAARERPIYEAMRAQNADAQRGHARRLAAIEWRREFEHPQNAVYRKMYSGRREIGSGQGQRGLPATRARTSGQLGLLLSRYFKVKTRDVSGTAIMLLQAPIIGLLLAIVFGGQEKSVPAWCLGALQRFPQGSGPPPKLVETADATAAIFFLVLAAVWFGTSNAAREIVAERAIYLRERMVNLGLVNYVLSKYLLLAMFCVLQCTCLLGIVFPALGLPGGAQAFGEMLGSLIATSLSAVALGLLLSTVVGSSEAAMALTPIALIPQVVLGGLMVPMTSLPKPIRVVMQGIPARWGFEGAIAPNRVALATDDAWLVDLGQKGLKSEFVEAGKFKCAIAQMASDSLGGSWGFTTYDDKWIPYAVLGGIAAFLVVIVTVLLKRRDPV